MISSVGFDVKTINWIRPKSNFNIFLLNKAKYTYMIIQTIPNSLKWYSTASKCTRVCRLLCLYRIPKKGLQRVQTTFTGYVLGQYAVLEDLQKLNWLPITKRRDLAILKITHKALYGDVWSDYLHLKIQYYQCLQPKIS